MSSTITKIIKKNKIETRKSMSSKQLHQKKAQKIVCYNIPLSLLPLIQYKIV